MKYFLKTKPTKTKENKFLSPIDNTCVHCPHHCRLFPSQPGSPYFNITTEKCPNHATTRDYPSILPLTTGGPTPECYPLGCVRQ